jgi:hypothetical protein
MAAMDPRSTGDGGFGYGYEEEEDALRIPGHVVDYDDEEDGEDGDDCFDTPIPCPDTRISVVPVSMSGGSAGGTTGDGELSGGLVIVCYGKICQILSQFLIRKLKLTNTSKVVGDESRNTYSTVWRPASEDGSRDVPVMLLVVDQKVPEQLAHQWVQLFSETLSKNRIVCIGGIPSATLVTVSDVLSHRSPAHIRHISTSAFKATHTPASTGSSRIYDALRQCSTEIGVGNVLTGLMANIMCFAEARSSVEAVALLTVCASSTAFTTDAAAALETVIPLVGALLLQCKEGGSELSIDAEDRATVLGSSIYKSVAQKDSFAIDTSNLYI